jgi:hypothetical protein
MAFPDGPIFVRGVQETENSSNTTSQYNLDMQAQMKSSICYLHEAGPNYVRTPTSPCLDSVSPARRVADTLARDV